MPVEDDDEEELPLLSPSLSLSSLDEDVLEPLLESPKKARSLAMVRRPDAELLEEELLEDESPSEDELEESKDIDLARR